MKRKLWFCLSIACLALTGCRCNDNLKNEYNLYYQYADASKGLEVYAWKEESGKWFTILMEGTNRYKSSQEVKELQDDLPCPIDDMKIILDFYRDANIYDFVVTIVSNPPKEEELTHDKNKSDSDYLYVLAKLGIK